LLVGRLLASWRLLPRRPLAGLPPGRWVAGAGFVDPCPARQAWCVGPAGEAFGVRVPGRVEGALPFSAYELGGAVVDRSRGM
jgi:hypothetical protein